MTPDSREPGPGRSPPPGGWPDPRPAILLLPLGSRASDASAQSALLVADTSEHLEDTLGS